MILLWLYLGLALFSTRPIYRALRTSMSLGQSWNSEDELFGIVTTLFVCLVWPVILFGFLIKIWIHSGEEEE